MLIIGDILSTFLTQNLRNVVLATQTGILTILATLLATFFKNLSLATLLATLSGSYDEHLIAR